MKINKIIKIIILAIPGVTSCFPAIISTKAVFAKGVLLNTFAKPSVKTVNGSDPILVSKNIATPNWITLIPKKNKINLLIKLLRFFKFIHPLLKIFSAINF